VPVRACRLPQETSQDNPASPSAIARIRQDPIGPAGLDASRYRGLSKSCVLACRSGSSDRPCVPQVRWPALPCQGETCRVPLHRLWAQALGIKSRICAKVSAHARRSPQPLC